MWARIEEESVKYLSRTTKVETNLSEGGSKVERMVVRDISPVREETAMSEEIIVEHLNAVIIWNEEGWRTMQQPKRLQQGRKGLTYMVECTTQGAIKGSVSDERHCRQQSVAR